MKLVAATQNAHKLQEIGAMLADLDIELVSMKDAGLANVEIEENGTSFEENSYIKAAEVCRLTGEAALADDSGLTVDCLGGAPGIYSARYGGEHGNDALNRKKLLEVMNGEEDRSAAFVCVITLVYPDGKKLVARGECKGRIACEESGSGGFGYDCIFIPEGYEESFGVLPAELKNSISHRAAALAELRRILTRR